jgi:hypothetical protein
VVRQGPSSLPYRVTVRDGRIHDISSEGFAQLFPTQNRLRSVVFDEHGRISQLCLGPSRMNLSDLRPSDREARCGAGRDDSIREVFWDHTRMSIAKGPRDEPVLRRALQTEAERVALKFKREAYLLLESLNCCHSNLEHSPSPTRCRALGVTERKNGDP